MTRLRVLVRWLPERVTSALVRLGSRRPRTVLGVALGLLLLALASTVGLRVEMDVLSLMPEHNRSVALFRDTLERFGTADVLLLAVEVERVGADEAIEYADRLAARLRDSESFDWLEYRQEDLLEAAAELLPWSTLFLEDDELERLHRRLDGEELTATIRALAADLRSPTSLGLRELHRRDPLGVFEMIARRGALGEQGERFGDSGYLIDPEGTLLMMLAKPSRPAADVVFSERLMTELETVRTELDAEWRAGSPEREPPELLIAGGYAMAAGDSERITLDVIVGSLSALVGVALLFSLAFRRRFAVLVAFTPLLFGLVYTAAFARLAFGRLNVVTSVFAAMLIGLGIDFVIVLYGRYLEERSDGLGVAEALEKIAHRTAVAVLIGATTTAVTMLAFLVADFRGLVELGLLTGVGILIVVTTVLATLPALLQLFDRSDYRDVTPAPLRAFGIDRLALLAQRRPAAVLGGVLVLTVVLASFAPRLRYDEDMLNLRSPDNPAVAAQQRIARAFGLRFTPYIVRFDGATEEEVLALAQRSLPELRRLVDGEQLARVESILDYLPSIERQRAVLERLARWQVEPDSLRARLEEALAAAGLKPAAFDDGIDALVHAVTLDAPLALDPLVESSLGPLLERYWHQDESGATLLVYAYAPPDRWRGQVPPALVDFVEARPQASLTGPVVVSRELKTVVRRDALLSASIGVVVVFLMLVGSFGSWRSGLIAMLPLAVGLPWMLGLMSLLGVAVNFLNMFVFTMLVGIAVDYGVHLMHRSLETPTHVGLRDTARAVVVAALTTLLGFGSLSLSHFPGLRSMGQVAVIGASSVALVAILLVPAVLTLLRPPVSAVPVPPSAGPELEHG